MGMFSNALNSLASTKKPKKLHGGASSESVSDGAGDKLRRRVVGAGTDPVGGTNPDEDPFGRFWLNIRDDTFRLM